jgi:hemin uptake protein HemP
VNNHEEPPEKTNPSPAPFLHPAVEKMRTWRSEDLFQKEDEVLIVHGEQVYRLRRTRNGKLILCK